MIAICLDVVFRKPNLVLTVNVKGKQVFVKVGERFKKNYHFLFDKELIFTKKVRGIIKGTMPKRIELIESRGKYYVDTLKILPWVEEVAQKI